jgi:hypothetical protein
MYLPLYLLIPSNVYKIDGSGASSEMAKVTKDGKTKAAISICPGCGFTFPLLQLPLHVHTCLQKRPSLMRELYAPTNTQLPKRCPSKRAIQDTNLPTSAIRALQHVETRARHLHTTFLEPLKTRVVSLGFSEAQLQSALGFIRERAPLIIHIHVPKVLHLLLR